MVEKLKLGSSMKTIELEESLPPVPAFLRGNKPIDRALDDVQALAKQPKQVEHHVTDALVEVANNLATALKNTAQEQLEKAKVNHDKAVKLADDLRDKAITEHERLLEITKTYNEYGNSVLNAYDKFIETLNSKK